MKRLFNVTVIINAVELLKNNFDIKEETKSVFASVEYYRDTLMDGMAEDGILEEYIDLFGCADPGVLFDKYITVDADGVQYNFDEDRADEGQHRDNCFFRVPCTFDLGKYIKAMDTGNAEDAGEDDEIGITVFRDTISRDLAGDDNLGTLIVKKDMLMKYFKERILPDFKGDDDTVSDEGLLQKWLDEYTADSTTDLYDFIQAEEKKVKKEHYQKLYDEKFDKLVEEARRDKLPEPEAWASDTFGDCATAEEVAGYYIAWHGDDAFKDWIENTLFYESERNKKLTAQDREVTRILGELYDNTVVRDIEWYIPEGTAVNPKLSEFKVIPKIKNGTDQEITEAVRLYLQLTYATEPKAFSFMLPDGRMAGYRNWELSSISKKDDGAGCYGAGSKPCLNGCTGCDRLKRELRFTTPNEMEAYLKDDGDAYNPITETFVSQYSEDGAIVVYTGISVRRARQLADETRHAGETTWLSVLGPGGAIYERDDFPFDNAAEVWCKDNFSEPGWVVADTDTFTNENLCYIHRAEDFEPVDWIVGISGSDMDDVEVKIVNGTTDQLKRHLISEIQNIIADGESDDWDSGAETTDDVTVNGDGKLYACACFRCCHFDLTATPVSSVSRINLSKEEAKTA